MSWVVATDITKVLCFSTTKNIKGQVAAKDTLMCNIRIEHTIIRIYKRTNGVMD